MTLTPFNQKIEEKNYTDEDTIHAASYQLIPNRGMPLEPKFNKFSDTEFIQKRFRGREPFEKFISKRKKIIIQAAEVSGHIIIDTMMAVFCFNKLFPDVDIIILMSGLVTDVKPERELIGEALIDSVNFMKEVVEARSNAKVFISWASKDDYVLVNRVFIPSFRDFRIYPGEVYHEVSAIIRDHIEKHYSLPKETKKVYISRAHTEPRSDSDLRVTDEHVLENFFKGLGFEIVYAEDFKTFKEQIIFFSSARAVAGVTGAGLNALMYIKDYSSFIEIAVPITINNDHGSPYTSYHHMYNQMACDKHMLQIRIPVENAAPGNEVVKKIKEARTLVSLFREL